MEEHCEYSLNLRDGLRENVGKKPRRCYIDDWSGKRHVMNKEQAHLRKPSMKLYYQLRRSQLFECPVKGTQWRLEGHRAA